MKKKFVIVDAMSLAYKAYFVFISRPLKTTSGEPTSAVYGFVTQLLKILEDTKPDYIAVALDSKEKTFRHEMYANYKSSRSLMPDDMIPQMQRIRQIIDDFGIPVYMVPGYEADDIIGTAVKKAEAAGLDVYVITPDKDFNQMVSDNVRLIKPGKTSEELICIDREKIKEEFGFEPKQMIDYLALIGDKSDDIPGVAGIGPKGACPLIAKFDSIEGIYEHIDEIDKPALRQKLLDQKENAFISKELATIITDVPFDFDLEKAVFTKPDIGKLNKIFLELEFRNFPARMEKIFGSKPEPVITAPPQIISFSEFDPDKVKYELIRDKNRAAELALELQKTELFVFDTEADSLDSFELNLAGVSFCIKPDEAYFVAVNPFKGEMDLFTKDLSDRLSLEEFTQIFKPVFENEKIKKVCQNAKYDIGVLNKYGIGVKNFYFDTMLASYALDPDQKHGMDELALKYLRYKPIPLTSIIGEKKECSKIFDTDLQKLSDYSAEDSDVTYKLYQILSSEVEDCNLHDMCYKVEFPLVEVLAAMEHTGVRVDTNMLKILSNDLQVLLDNYTTHIFRLAGEEFNINSPAQMQKILFDKLGLDRGKKTKTGFSTDARSLENLKGMHEIIDIILDYRQVSKLKNTYVDSLPEMINKRTGRIHTCFNQSVVSTGRLSSINPNLQNIPIKTEMGKEIRKAFVPADKDHVILSADYSQIELRIMASICKDEGLCSAFANGDDIHRNTAAQVFMVEKELVTREMRNQAKQVNFGILYGIGVFGLKTRLGITQTHAKNIMDTYFKSFSKVKAFMDLAVEKAKSKGYAETLMGRRRFLRNINSSNRVVRQFEERAAINMPIQGTAADMIKLAMIKIHDELFRRNAKTRMVLQVHDELLFDAHKSEIDELRPLIKEIMENALPLEVPVVVDTGVGENWLDAH